MKTIILVLGVLVSALVLFAWYIGFFANLTVTKTSSGSFVVAGLPHTGPYKDVGVVMKTVDNKLRDMGIACEKGLGIYYDDPKNTPPEALRSFVGNILTPEQASRLDEIRGHGLEIEIIEDLPSLMVEMKARSNITYMVGPMKAYPLLSKYQEDHLLVGNKTFEIYDIPNKKVSYVVQLKT